MQKIKLTIKGEELKKKLNLKDGKTPIAGVDFPLPKDGKTPIAGIDFPLPEKGKDGNDGSPDTRLQIVEKINSGIETDLKIKSNQVEGFDKLINQDGLNRAVSILDSRTSFLINKVNNLPSGSSTDEKVKLNALDPTAGYLDDKIVEGNYNVSDFNNDAGYITGVNVPANETDPLSLHLDQTTPQTLTASPIFNWGTQSRLPYYSSTKTLTDSDTLTFDDINKVINLYGSLGTEKVTNGSFATDSGWTKGTGWTISEGKAVKGSNGTGLLSQSILAYGGEIYYVTFTVLDWTVGSVTLSVGGTTVATVSANGTYIYKVVATNATVLSFTPTNTSRFSIDNVSVKKMSGASFNLAGNIRVSGVQTIAQDNSSYLTNTSHLTLWNYNGSYSHLLFKHGTTSASSLTSYYSSGVATLQLNAYGTNGIILLKSNTLDILQVSQLGSATNYPFVFRSTVSIGGGDINPKSNVAIHGSVGHSATYVKAGSYTPTSSDYVLLCDTTLAQACVGTASTACSTYTNQYDCEERYNHGGGCTWSEGSSCSVFSYEAGMSNCVNTSGCSASTGSCSDGSSDQTTCEGLTSNYGGYCYWDGGGNFTECQGDYSSWCAQWTNYTAYDCETNSNGLCTMPGGDYNTCEPLGNCAGISSEGLCSGSDYPYVSGCTPIYSSPACLGTGYYTGNCEGTYGSGCSGTPLCSGIGDQTNCNNESGCTWGSSQTINLPQGSTVLETNGITSRELIIKKVRGSGNVNIVPYSGDDIDGSSSYTISTLLNSIRIQYFPLGKYCNSLLSSTECADQSGCSWIDCTSFTNGEDCTGNGCSWDSENSACYGDYCSGTPVFTKRWHILENKN